MITALNVSLALLTLALATTLLGMYVWYQTHRRLLALEQSVKIMSKAIGRLTRRQQRIQLFLKTEAFQRETTGIKVGHVGKKRRAGTTRRSHERS